MKRTQVILALMLSLAPYLYLVSVWDALPEQVPTHFNGSGEADDWSHKNLLWFLPSAMPGSTLLVLLAIPAIDPKNKIRQMGDRYGSLALLLTFFMTLLAFFVLYSTQEGEIARPTLLFALIGALFAGLGNYLQTVRPNYFIGIRTPWTLENETVWVQTHRLGGRIWMAGGILQVVLALVLPDPAMIVAFLGLAAVMAVVPIVHSFVLFKRLKQGETTHKKTG